MARPSPNLGTDKPEGDEVLHKERLDSHGLPSFGVAPEGPPTFFGKGEHKGQTSPFKDR